MPRWRRAAWWMLLSGAAAAWTGCGDGDPPADPCPGGVCVADPDGGSRTSDGGGPPVDGSTPRPDGAAPRSDGGACVESWLCSPWETDGTSDVGTRTCTDMNGCGTTANKPVESAMLPALDENYFRCEVEPTLDWGCTQLACHGAERGRALRLYARGRHRIAGDTFIEPGCLMAGTPHPSEECEGSIECRCFTLPRTAEEWRRNYDSARGFALQNDGSRIPAGMEASSELVQQPLIGGGFAHAGIHMIQSGTPRYDKLVQWLSGATRGPCTTIE